MKKKLMTMALALLFAPCVVWAQTAGQTYYVSASGHDTNDGLTEDRPMKDLSVAVNQALNGTIKKITVIGTLDETSQFMSVIAKRAFGAVFGCMASDEDDKTEITITGKPGASGAARAVLSAKGSGAGVIYVSGGIRIRFEHIEISGGEKAEGESGGEGIDIQNEGTRVTLGPGAVVRGNNGLVGVFILSGSCVIDGGEIRDNAGAGVGIIFGALTLRNGSIANNKSIGNGGGVSVAGKSSVFTMSGGSITGNTASGAGGGVYVVAGGRFTMSGGSITGNTASDAGGGVYVQSGAAFTQTGGSITGNRAARGSNPNIFVAQGATVSLLPGSSSSSASRPASPAPRQTEGSISSADEEPTPRPAPAPAPAKRRRFSDPDAGVYFAGSLGSDVRLFNASPVAFGAPLQMGIGFNFLRMRLALLGEGQIGIGGGTQDGNVYLFFELSAGGAAELYFPGRVIGVGAAWNLFRDKNLGDIPIAGRDDTKTSYQRLGLIFQGPGSLKTTLYALRFNDDSWGFGVQIGGAWGLER